MIEARQLAFEIARAPELGAEDFLVSASNSAAWSILERWPAWPDPVVLLVGPSGVGKSHLAAIWARRAGARRVALPDAAGDLPDAPILLDDADQFGAEAALFHLINMVGERRTTLLLTASQPPELWPVRLPDLLSRLRRATRVEIGSPDDDLMRAVLVKLLFDRQLLVDASVVEFIARRIDRSLDAARALVSRLDAESLSSGRPITRGLAADILRRVDAEPAEDCS